MLASTTADDFNAIDPGVIVDAAGDPWMAFGSFWSGIRMVALEWPDGKRADAAEPLRLADRGVPPNAIEAPYIVEHDGDYFLFVSFDSCCKALGSTYHVMVGRADEVTGPYLDRDGVPLLEGGGTSVLEGDGGVHIGPGGQSVGGRNARRALLRRPLQRRLPARAAPARLGLRRLADRPLVIAIVTWALQNNV